MGILDDAAKAQSQPTQPQVPPTAAPTGAAPQGGSILDQAAAQQAAEAQTPAAPALPVESTTDRWKREAYETIGQAVPQAAISPLEGANKILNRFHQSSKELGNIAEKVNTLVAYADQAASDLDEDLGGPKAKHETIPAYAKGLEGTYLRHKAETEAPILTGVTGGLANLGGQILGDPTNWPFLAKGLLTSVGKVSEASLMPWAEKLMSKGFGLQMSRGVYDQLGELQSNWSKMSDYDKSHAITQIIAGTYMAQSAVREGFRGEPKAKVETSEAPQTVGPEAGGEGPRTSTQTGTVAGEQTTLRPTTRTTAGVEAPVSAKAAATLEGEQPSIIARAAEQLTSPTAETRFGKEQTAPAATRQAVSTVGQVAEDRIEQHKAIVNGESAPETISGTQQASRFTSPDEAWQEMQKTAQDTTFRTADDISQREQKEWEAKRDEAVQEYKDLVDRHNQNIDDYNAQVKPDQRMPHAVFDPNEVAVPERPATYNELRADVQRAQTDARSGDAAVREEAIKTGLPKAEKAMDNWFKQHSDEISPAEYDSVRKLWSDSERMKEIAMGLRGPLTKGNLTGNQMRQIEVSMNNRQLRRGQSPDAFQRLLGADGYNNWQNVAKLFDTVKDPTLPEQFASWGKYATEYLVSALIPHLTGAGIIAKWGVEKLLNHVMFDPEFGSTFGKVVDWLKDQKGRVVDSITELPASLRDRLVNVIKSYQDAGEKGMAGRDINKPRFGRKGLGGSAEPTNEDVKAASAPQRDTDILAQVRKDMPTATLSEQLMEAARRANPKPVETVSSNFQPVGHEEYARAVNENPQAATLTAPEDTVNNRKFSNGEGVYYSISPEGDLQGLVNNSGKRGAIAAAMPHAIEQGAKTLDAWDLYLPKQYEKYGFERTERVPYDVAKYGEPSQALKDAWKAQGWKEGEEYPAVQYMRLKPAAPETLQAHHWSSVPDLTETNPAKMGTGVRGAERARMNEPDFIQRTNFGLEGYKEPAVQSKPYHYVSDLQASKYYDAQNDPEGIWTKGFQEGGATGAEKAVKDAGYHGYRVGNEVASFEKVPVRPYEAHKAILDALGAGAKLIGSQATGKATATSDTDIKVASPVEETALAALGYKLQGTSTVSPKEAAAYDKPIDKGWSTVQHFVNGAGKKVDVWSSEPQAEPKPEPVYIDRKNGTHEVVTGPESDRKGYLLAKDVPSEKEGEPSTEVRVASHWVDSEERGKGFGSAQLETLAKGLAESGKTALLSDTKMTDSARGSWKRLMANYPLAVTETPEGYRFDLEKLRAPATTKTTAEVKGSTVQLMKNPLPVKATGETGVSTIDVAKALNKYTKRNLGALQPGSEPKEMVARATELAEDEARYQLAQSNSGTTWYTEQMDEHDKVAKEMRPVLNNDTKLSLFKFAEAILSSGQKPYRNFISTMEAFDHYEKTGRFSQFNPATGKSWGPRGVAAYGNAFEMLNRLIDERGEKGTVDWLMSEHPVSELRVVKGGGAAIPGKKTDMLMGTAILGDKRGPFAQNLHGLETAFTADMWVSRAWNRWMGSIETDPETGEVTSDTPRNQQERALMKQSFSDVAQKLGLTVSSLQAVLWYYEQALYTAHGTPKESWSFSDAARRAQAEEKAKAPAVAEAPQEPVSFGPRPAELARRAREESFNPDEFEK